jgi:hypothetical protein
MKKKGFLIILVIIVQLIVITSSINAFTINNNSVQKQISKTTTITFVQHFSQPHLKDNEDCLNIIMKETNAFITQSGEPILPLFQQTFEFPLGTRITDITGTLSDIEEMHISKKIMPATTPFPYAEDTSNSVDCNEQVYTNNAFFPTTWYSYKLVGGLNKHNEHTTFLTLQIYPIRYNPVTDTIQYINSITLDISYTEPQMQIQASDVYDLLIISYDLYKPHLEPLVDHKENLNITTKLVTLKDIYNSVYFPVTGKDKPEKIKYFIKNAVENWNISYVLLVGNFRKVPIIHTHLETDAGGMYEELYYASDLYYADIYNADGNFSSWDTNENGIYGEWPDPGVMVDTRDLAPDVHLGRFACMFASEVKSIVTKIIDYEQLSKDAEWFNTMIVCGGDTFDKSWEGGTDYDEGEVANEKALEYMATSNAIRLYASQDNLTTQNMLTEISKGAGFVYFSGHGNPKHWATHKNGDYINWTEGLSNKDIGKLTNTGKYPIVIVGGCHNSEYDTTPLNLLKGLLTEGLGYFLYDSEGFGSYYLYNWVLECWSWVFLKNPTGGAIASIGSVGYGGVSIGDHNGNEIPDCIEGLDGWFETQLFRLYSEEHIDILGETYTQLITNYINQFPVYTDRYDCKIVETHLFLGDPTLKIGGY